MESVSIESKTTAVPAAFQVNLYDLDGNLTDGVLWLHRTTTLGSAVSALV